MAFRVSASACDSQILKLRGVQRPSPGSTVVQCIYYIYIYIYVCRVLTFSCGNSVFQGTMLRKLRGVVSESSTAVSRHISFGKI